MTRRSRLVFALFAVFPFSSCAPAESDPAPVGASPASYAPGYVVEGGVVQPVNNLPNPYETQRDWGRLPDNRPWGSVSALEVDPDGRHLWVAERCGTNSCAGSTVDVIVKLDPEGNPVTSFGAGRFIWPHGMHIDADGNLWVTDARGANANELQQFPNETGKGHAVYKFSPTGELLLTLGTPGARGDGTGAELAEPNDVITADDVLYAIDSESGPRNPGWRKGLRVGSARTGEVWYYVPQHDSEEPSGGGGFGAMGEGVAVDAAGNVYGGEVGPVQGLTKFVPRLKR